MQGCELVMSKGVKAIAEGCRRLNFLRAADCKKIDDVGIVKIGENCPDMEELDLEDCKAVTDVGIMTIADGCTNLKNLKINRCKKVTNKGMIALSDNCRKLEELDVWHCPKLTDIRVEKLFVETCKISGLLGSQMYIATERSNKSMKSSRPQPSIPENIIDETLANMKSHKVIKHQGLTDIGYGERGFGRF